MTGRTRGEAAPTDNAEFRGEIKVASRIVDYLSSGLYESPAACLKELINNAYDADAAEVNVFVKPDADRIIIEDNGHGMDRADFERHFSRISESFKREHSDQTASGRPKIGKIGIGFIAANEICDVMEIYSTKKGSTELLHVSIFFEKMRQDPEERRRQGEQFAKGDYVGEIGTADSASHFTQIFLKKVRGAAREILAGAGARAHMAGERSVYGLSAESIEAILRDPGLKTWAEFDSYSQNFLKVGLNVPVQYYDDFIPGPLGKPTKQFRDSTMGLGFSLCIDGSEVRKPIVFSRRQESEALVSPFNFTGQHVRAHGYFYVQHGNIRPQELQGLLIRIRNAAVGAYDPSFLGFSPSEGPLFQSWISGEIWANDQLEDAMNIDRRTLRVTHPAFVEFQKAVHEHLSGLLKRARSELYGEGSRARTEERSQRVVNEIYIIADSDLKAVSRAAAAQVKRAWKNVAETNKGSKRLLKKYSLPEFYRIFIEVTEGILTPEELEEIMRRLSQRLSR